MRRTTFLNAPTSWLSTPARRRGRSRRRRRYVGTAVSVEIDDGSNAACEPARVLDERCILGPRQCACRARELGVVVDEHLGDELEGAAPLLGSVRAIRVLEEHQSLLERRERDLRLGLRLRPGGGAGPRRGTAKYTSVAPATASAPARTRNATTSSPGDTRYETAGSEMRSARQGFGFVGPVGPSRFAAANREYTRRSGHSTPTDLRSARSAPGRVNDTRALLNSRAADWFAGGHGLDVQRSMKVVRRWVVAPASRRDRSGSPTTSHGRNSVAMRTESGSTRRRSSTTST